MNILIPLISGLIVIIMAFGIVFTVAIYLKWLMESYAHTFWKMTSVIVIILFFAYVLGLNLK